MMSFHSLVRNCYTHKGGMPWRRLSGIIITTEQVLCQGFRRGHCLVYGLCSFRKGTLRYINLSTVRSVQGG
jgi:hypothetical protein